ncbi:sugar ABC transporter ATP-binding protein [Entomospira culicis]|uniref:ATP-binding cassette domain-containing protein n=1 Tax=Entomospira culicis TaxID=2719989 RepID=A0A968KW50_9SPIO|nr:ATP-binding cassette domain-containing protein [Entomospira culicis]NIZ19649.1 ATP-binding cassette domain-containing protein [Entomospira culicis]NIZ69863.1 ATP-binding cassette domain-containing protein [Entomospira culicis]WDI36969.1 ATP-binding cassette domain-containing protein [Entomospira culicis]WDI38598.1 ATP-binding cassette domain-containing protein [Entomospira culicis]
MKGECLLSLEGVSKSFPGVKALDEANLRVYAGRVMALMGENGAGKSTLMKILSGIYQQDAGKIYVNHQEVQYQGVVASQRLGIGIVHQELNLVAQLKVYENIFLAKESSALCAPLRHQRERKAAQGLLDELHFSLDVDALVGTLSIAQQQLVEIAKCLSMQAKVIILDEPTDALTEKESLQLFAIIQKLKAQGKGIVFISHRLKEVFAIADDVTILRDGKWMGEYPVTDIHEDRLIELMVGRTITEQFPFERVPRGKEMLKVHQVRNAYVQNISFTLHASEVLGISGLMGSGRTKLVKSLAGVYPYEGVVYVDSRPLKTHSIQESLAHRLVYVSEDRKQDGLVLSLSVAENMVLSLLTTLKRRLRRSILHGLVDDFIAQLHIKTPSRDKKVGELSGGNQQKVAIAKALLLKPKVLILDEPTRGIDVGAKKEIYQLINQLKREGLAILLISSELPEIMGLSDRIIVLHAGKAKGLLVREAFDAQKIMAMSMN